MESLGTNALRIGKGACRNKVDRLGAEICKVPVLSMSGSILQDVGITLLLQYVADGLFERLCKLCSLPHFLPGDYF